MKKFLSILLVILMMLPMTVACGNASGGDEDSSASQSETEAITTDAQPVLTDVDLSEFVILYENSAQNDLAKLLRDKIHAKTGVLLPINRYKTVGGEKDHEFLLDPTHRPLSVDYAAQDFSEACKKYGYIIENGKVCLAGYDSLTIEKSMDLFLQDYVKETSKITIEDKLTNLVELDFETEKLPVGVKDGEIRVMSNNVIRAKYAPVSQRIENLKVAYAIFDADVIALQECGKAWLYSGGLVETLKEIGYELVPYDNEECSNPLFYRTKTLNLIESGDVQYKNNDTANDAYRSYAWGYFEQKSTQKKFVVTSTHLSPDDSTIRLGSTKQLADELKAIETKYGVPVIMLGDYNARVATGVYSTMKLKYNSARDKAQERINMGYNTFLGNINLAPESGTNVLDHCFYSKSGINATRFETIISKYAGIYTDHLAIICDFSFE